MMSQGTAAAIQAIAALAQAGGAGFLGYEQGKSADAELALHKRKLLLDQQNRTEDLRRDDARYADTLSERRRAASQAAPMNSLNLLSGIASLRNSWSQPTGLDVLGLLAKG